MDVLWANRMGYLRWASNVTGVKTLITFALTGDRTQADVSEISLYHVARKAGLYSKALQMLIKLHLLHYNLTLLDMYNGLSQVYSRWFKPDGIILKHMKG